MSEWITQELEVIRTLLIAATGVGGVASVFIVYVVTKALTKTLGALLLAGAVVWGVANVDWFKTKIGEETDNSMAVVGGSHEAASAAPAAGPRRAVVVLDPAGSPSSVALVGA